jgi:tetratricopeptide (TPR) repeat protein
MLGAQLFVVVVLVCASSSANSGTTTAAEVSMPVAKPVALLAARPSAKAGATSATSSTTAPAAVPNLQYKTFTIASICADAKLKPHLALDIKNRGMTLLQAGRIKESIAEFDTYVNCCPNSWRAFACRATAKVLAGDELGSVEDITRYLYIKRNASFHIRESAERSDVENKARPGAIDPPELSISLDECDRLRKIALRRLDKTSSSYQMAQALISFFEHDYRRALNELSQIKGKDSMKTAVLVMRSVCHRATGSFDDSIKEAKEAISRAPDLRVPYDTLDGAFFACDKREEGLRELTKMTALYPSKSSLILTIADINSQLGNRDQAKILLTKLISSVPSSVQALTMRADIFKADLMNDKAFVDYKAASILNPRDGKAIEGMGFCSFELNRIEQASQYFDQAMALGYDLKRICAAQSLCLEKQGKPALAGRLRAASQYFMY